VGRTTSSAAAMPAAVGLSLGASRAAGVHLPTAAIQTRERCYLLAAIHAGDDPEKRNGRRKVWGFFPLRRRGCWGFWFPFGGRAVTTARG
jgi:hypothetical protein